MISEAFALIVGRWFGQVYPAKEPRPLPAADARDHALRRFREFLAALVFSRKGDTPGSTISFQVPIDSIFVDQPDDPQRLTFPAISIVSARGDHDTYKLGPFELQDDSLDVYGPGTALLEQGWYEEEFTLEVWGNHPADRLALLAGIKAAMRMSQRSYALILTLPNYYDQTAQFSLEASQSVDDPSVILGRRRAQLYIALGVSEVLLVNAATLQPAVVVQVVDATGELDDGSSDPAG